MKVFIIINIENISVTPQKIVTILLQSFLSSSLAQAITDLFFFFCHYRLDFTYTMYSLFGFFSSAL